MLVTLRRVDESRNPFARRPDLLAFLTFSGALAALVFGLRGARLDIRFQTIFPQQIIGDTELGRQAAEAYAQRQGVSVEKFLAGFGAPMPPREVGENVVSILTDTRYATGVCSA